MEPLLHDSSSPVRLQAPGLKACRSEVAPVSLTFKNPLKYTLRDIGKALRWGKRVNAVRDLSPQRDDEFSATGAKQMSPVLICFLIALYFSGYTLQYYIFNLYLTELPGNKFINLAIFGITEAASVILSGFLMNLLADMKVFYITYGMAVLGYVVFIFIPDADLALIYIANCVFVGSMGAWQNLGFLIAELRVPPQSLGAVNFIAQTAGLSLGALVPFIS